MVSFCDHIEYLIGRHDCVVVPGWGAFVAQCQPAHIDAESATIYPPKRVIGFNPAICHNDGLLVTSVMRREGATYDNALRQVDEEVRAMRCQLDADGEVAVGRLGLLRRNGDGTPMFLPAEDDVVSGRFYGLAPVKAVPLLQAAREEAAVDDAEKGGDVIYLPISRNIFKIAASIALILGLGFALSTPVIVNREADNYASIASVPTVTPSIEVRQRADAELFISIPGDDAAPAASTVPVVQPTTDIAKSSVAKPRQEAEAVTAKEPKAAIRLDDSDPYCLVVASHATMEQARKQVAGRSDLHILESGGRYRVYVATGRTTAQAKLPMGDSAFAARYPGAWVCKR